MKDDTKFNHPHIILPKKAFEICDKWIDLSIIIPELKTNINKRYEINGELHDIRDIELLTNGQKITYRSSRKKKPAADGYLYQGFHIVVNGKSKKIVIIEHLIFAAMFIDNPEQKPTVDHIDKNRTNNYLSNLRWATRSTQRLNQNRGILKDYLTYIAYSDKNKTNEVFRKTSKEFLDWGKDRSSVRTSINLGHSYHGYYWKIIDSRVAQYLKPEEKILESLWKTHYSNKFQVHPLGFVRALFRNSTITLGTKSKYFTLGYSTYKSSVHVAIAEVFLNDNQPIPSGYEIDHIDGDRFNNRLTNLRIVNHSENMKNIHTQKKLKEASKRKIKIDNKVYSSIQDASKSLNISESSISRKLKNINFQNYSYIN